VWWKFFLGIADVLVADPAGIKYVMNSSNFVKPSRLRGHFARIVGGESLLVLEGKEHAVHRAVINPAFNYANVKAMIPVFDAMANRLVDYWMQSYESHASEIAAGEDLGRLTFDSICKTAFGFDMNSLHERSSPIVTHFQNLFFSIQPSFVRMLPFFFSLPIDENRRREKSRLEIEKLIVDIVHEKIGSTKAHSSRVDLLDRLLEVQESNPESSARLSDDQIMTHLLTFAAAGHDTTSSSLAFTLNLLSRNESIRHRAQREARDILQEYDGVISYEAVEEMPFVQAVIKESMRLFPPAAINMRTPIKDDVVCGYTIPAGANIILSTIVMHRHPDLWERAEDFWPDRWLQTDFAPANTVYMPFGAGIHSCVGQKLALLQMRVILARVLAAPFDFVAPEGYTPKRRSNLTLRLDPSLVLKLVPPAW
jgi:cytochrome P450